MRKEWFLSWETYCSKLEPNTLYASHDRPQYQEPNFQKESSWQLTEKGKDISAD